MRLVAVINEMEESLKDSDFAKQAKPQDTATLDLAHSWSFNRGYATTFAELLWRVLSHTGGRSWAQSRTDMPRQRPG
jgi:hypothetical protein